MASDNIVSLVAERQARDRALAAAQEEAFAEYVRLAEKAQATLLLNDGMAAGEAWGNYIALFAAGGAPTGPARKALALGLVRLVNGPRKRAMVERLATAYPRPVTREQLIEAIYGDDPDGGPDSAMWCIRSFARDIRKALRPAGWTIKAEMGRSANAWRLVEANT